MRRYTFVAVVLVAFSTSIATAAPAARPESCTDHADAVGTVVLGVAAWDEGGAEVFPLVRAAEALPTQGAVHRVQVTAWGDASALVVGGLRLEPGGATSFATTDVTLLQPTASWQVELGPGGSALPELSWVATCTP